MLAASQQYVVFISWTAKKRKEKKREWKKRMQFNKLPNKYCEGKEGGVNVLLAVGM